MNQGGEGAREHGGHRMGTDRPSLSLCMIVRDEAAELAKCLASIAGVVEEIVVVDTGSADGTPALAAQYGARVILHPWQDDFSAARNAALAEARGDWILVLDADEELEPADRDRLRRLLVEAPWDGGRLRIRNRQPQGELCAFQDLRITRLFRNRPSYRYEGIVHEQITPSIVRSGGTVGDAELTIHHHGYARRSDRDASDRAKRNLRLLTRAIDATPDDPYLQYQYGATLKMVGAGLEARQALERALRSGGDSLSGEALDLIHMKLAQLALGEERLQDAIAHARASLTVRPENVLSLCVLGLAYLFGGDTARALPALQAARGMADGCLVNGDKLDAIVTYCHLQLRDGPRKERATPLS